MNPSAPKRARHTQSVETFVKTVKAVIERGAHSCSQLEDMRRSYKPAVPPMLLNRVERRDASEPTSCVANPKEIASKFPNLFGQPLVHLVARTNAGTKADSATLRVGCVLSGGQASGGHNCIVGLFDYLRDHHPGSSLFGFTGGPKGVMTNEFV